MSEKNTAEVIIAGKVITLSGYESEEYFQRIATYINHKITELEGMKGYNHLTPDMKNTLLNINIADDYFKTKKQVEQLEADTEQKEKDLYDIKHDLVTAQIKKEESENKVAALNKELLELQKKVIQLETRLTSQKKP